MALSDRSEVGYVVWGSPPIVAVCRADGKWTVVQGSVPLPGLADTLEVFYEGFVDFPAYRGQRRLEDLARRTGGRRVMRELPPDPPGVET